MKQTKTLFIHSIIIFLLCCLCHFGYTFLPNFISSIFFPVNESVFEHLKMLFTAQLLFSIIAYFWEKDHNFFLRAFFRGYVSIFLLLLFYLPITHFFGEIMIVTFIILFISIFLTECILNYLPMKKHYRLFNFISVLLIILSYIMFTYFTYYPLKENLFKDYEKNQYGIIR